MLEIRFKRTDTGSNKYLKRQHRKIDKKVKKIQRKNAENDFHDLYVHQEKVLETYEEYIDLIMDELIELRAIAIPFGYYITNREYVNNSLKGKILRDRIKMLREITIHDETGGD